MAREERPENEALPTVPEEEGCYFVPKDPRTLRTFKWRFVVVRVVMKLRSLQVISLICGPNVSCDKKGWKLYHSCV